MDQKTKKKIFGIAALLFVLACIGFTIDIFSRTTLPGKKKHLPESIKSR